MQLEPEYGIVEVVKYKKADTTAPSFYADLVDQAISLGADAIVGCDFKVCGLGYAGGCSEHVVV